MLRDADIVGAKVFKNRPNGFHPDELPAINIYFGEENADVIEGDRYVPQMYERSYNITVDIFGEQPVNPNTNTAIDIEDVLDSLARSVEFEIATDMFFQKRLPGYEDFSSAGLLAGSRLMSTIPDSIELDSERKIAVQSVSFMLTYNDEAFFEEKSSIIESYLVKFNRVDYDDDTVDPTLIEASGDVAD